MIWKRTLATVSLVGLLFVAGSSQVFGDELDNEQSAEIKVKIDSSLFDSTCIRLNKEIYDIASLHFSKSGVKEEITGSSPLASSYLEVVNPLVPLALSICETGGWKNPQYTWTPAIYSKPLAQAGMDLSSVSIREVSTETYIVMNLSSYMGCGSNCTASLSQHYHFQGLNDNDSLGPLQTLRRYVEPTNGITYSCGERVSDLMRWEDNVLYLKHTLSKSIDNAGSWAKEQMFHSTEQLVAMTGALHNTGPTFLTRASATTAAASNWNNCGAIFNFARDITTDENLALLNAKVDAWYENEAKPSVISGKEYEMLGEHTPQEMDNILNELGINKSAYASSYNHKQYYPLRAVLNYLCLKKLYTSGGE